jgi:hypothetical protein
MSLDDRVYIGSVLAKRSSAALHLIAAAMLLTGSMTNAPGIMVRNRNGAAVERGHVSGRVGRLDQNGHSFTLSWQGKGLTKMEYYHFSYEQTYRVTEGTIYQNGSWADMKKGIRVRIRGHADVADTVEFTK